MKIICKAVDRDEALRLHNKGCVVEATPREGREQWIPIRYIGPESVKDEVPQGEVDLLKAALVRCITIIQCSHGIATETEEWASSSDAMKKILAIDAVAGAKKALHGIPH